MMLASNVRAELEYASIPLITGVVEKASMGMVPGGAYRNKKHQSCMVHFAKPVSDAEADVLFDPQTSGGLLFSLPEEDARVLTRQNVGWRIGRVLPPGEDGKLLHIV